MLENELQQLANKVVLAVAKNNAKKIEQARKSRNVGKVLWKELDDARRTYLVEAGVLCQASGGDYNRDVAGKFYFNHAVLEHILRPNPEK